MTISAIQKIEAMYRRSKATSIAGAELADEIDTLLDFDGMTADELRNAMRDVVAQYREARQSADAQYQEEGKKLGEA